MRPLLCCTSHATPNAPEPSGLMTWLGLGSGLGLELGLGLAERLAHRGVCELGGLLEQKLLHVVLGLGLGLGLGSGVGLGLG